MWVDNIEQERELRLIHADFLFFEPLSFLSQLDHFLEVLFIFLGELSFLYSQQEGVKNADVAMHLEERPIKVQPEKTRHVLL